MMNRIEGAERVSTNPEVTVESIRKNGIVGAGGAGFPTYAKLRNWADVLILNAAECEPLLHKDKQILENYMLEVLSGMMTIQSMVGASRSVLGIKKKNEELIEKLEAMIPDEMEIYPFDDFYPAGDEVIMVHEILGKAIPPGGLPIDVGAIVQNVETVYNVSRNVPVTSKFLTVGGAVENPFTVEVPLGMLMEDVLKFAGSLNLDEPYEILSDGVMMGNLVEDAATPVTKTCGAILVFPVDHPLIRRYRRPLEHSRKLSQSACDQCVFCTQLCPRYLVGHPIQPHLSMRALMFKGWEKGYTAHNLFCSGCNLCSMFSCPENLDPRNVSIMFKEEAQNAGLKYEQSYPLSEPHPLIKQRRAPLKKIIQQLGLADYSNTGPLMKHKMECDRVVLPLKMHIGVAAQAIVKKNDTVKEGQLIADVPADALGAPVHASISGKVVHIDNKEIRIEK